MCIHIQKEIEVIEDDVITESLSRSQKTDVSHMEGIKLLAWFYLQCEIIMRSNEPVSPQECKISDYHKWLVDMNMIVLLSFMVTPLTPTVVNIVN